MIDWYRDYYGQKGSINTIYYKTLMNSLKGKNPEETILNIYTYIQNNFIYLKGSHFSPVNVNELIYRKKGTSRQLILLMKSMMQYYGYSSYLALIRPFNSTSPSSWYSSRTYNNLLLYIPLSYKKKIWIDFSSKYYSLGTVSPQYTGEKAVIIFRKGFLTQKVQLHKQHTKELIFKIAVKSSGNCSMSLNAHLKGYYSVLKSYFENREKREDRLVYYMNTFMPLFILKKYSWIEYGKQNFSFTIKGEGLQVAAVGKRSLILSPVLNKSSLKRYFRYYKRKLPLHLEKDIHEKEKYIYNLPEKYISLKINKIFSDSTSNGRFIIKIIKNKGSCKLTVTKRLIVKHCIIKPADYKRFMQFYLKLRNAENYTVLLRI
jgi:hypothetical protein